MDFLVDVCPNIFGTEFRLLCKTVFGNCQEIQWTDKWLRNVEQGSRFDKICFCRSQKQTFSQIEMSRWHYENFHQFSVHLRIQSFKVLKRKIWLASPFCFYISLKFQQFKKRFKKLLHSWKSLWTMCSYEWGFPFRITGALLFAEQTWLIKPYTRVNPLCFRNAFGAVTILTDAIQFSAFDSLE